MNENLNRSIKIHHLIDEWKLHSYNLLNVVEKLKKLSLSNIDERIVKEVNKILKEYDLSNSH